MIGRIGEWMYQFLWLCWKWLVSVVKFNFDDARMLTLFLAIHFTHKGEVVEIVDDEEGPDDNT